MARRSALTKKDPLKRPAIRLGLSVLLMVSVLSACGRVSGEPAPSGASSGTISEEATPKPDQKPFLSPKNENPGTANASASGATTETPQQTVTPSASVPPTREVLSAFPGILRAMTLPRETVLSILGSECEVYANLPLAYTVYTWNGDGLSLEYDDLTGQLKTIRAGERSLFLDGADYREADLNGDGALEGICAYEAVGQMEGIAINVATDPAARRQGYVTILDQGTGALLAETLVSSFSGYARLTFLPSYGKGAETLIVLDTQADWECDVLSYTGGQLVSMLPTASLHLDSDTLVSTDSAHPDSIYLEVPSARLSFYCVLPGKLVDALEEGHALSYRFVVNRKPVVTDEGLSLRLRHSLQVLLGSAEALDGTQTNRYIDVGQVTQEYRYIGAGEWELLSTGGGAKYAEAAQGSDLYMEDMVAGQTYLFSSLYDIEETYGLDPSKYTDFDLMAGLRFVHKGLRIKVVNARVSRMEADMACPLETVRGLKTGESRGAALSALGLPDVGYFEDRIWTYWFYRGLDEPGERVLSLDHLTIEFSGDLVDRIRMEGYVPID